MRAHIMHVATDGDTCAGSRVMLVHGLVHGLTDTKSLATSSPPAAVRSLTQLACISIIAIVDLHPLNCVDRLLP